MLVTTSPMKDPAALVEKVVDDEPVRILVIREGDASESLVTALNQLLADL